MTNATSLFDYAPGMGTDDFTNKDWPKENATSCTIPTREDIRPIEFEMADKLCEGVLNKADRANCAFDVALTGEPGFAKTYVEGQELVQRATEPGVVPERQASRAGEPHIDSVVRLKPRRTGERRARR